jgi:DNA-binding winged helix-turn-helix (wHTH) protein
MTRARLTRSWGDESQLCRSHGDVRVLIVGAAGCPSKFVTVDVGSFHSRAAGDDRVVELNAPAIEGDADLILIGVSEPDFNAASTMQAMRARGIFAPAIVWHDANCSILKISAILEAVARAQRPAQPTDYAHEWRLQFDGLRVDPWKRTVHRDGMLIELRPKEFDLLLALIGARGRVMTRTELLAQVWQYEPGVVSRTVDTHLGELRRKIEHDSSQPRHIITVRKVGFRFAS